MSITVPVAGGDNSFNDFMAAFVGLVERFTTPAGRRSVVTSLTGEQFDIECPEWCVVDHAAFGPVGFLEDVCHEGPTRHVNAPHGRTELGRTEPILRANLSDWPNSKLEPVVSLQQSDEEFADLTPEMAEKLADDLVQHAGWLRELAAEARAIRSGR